MKKIIICSLFLFSAIATASFDEDIYFHPTCKISIYNYFLGKNYESLPEFHVDLEMVKLFQDKGYYPVTQLFSYDSSDVIRFYVRVIPDFPSPSMGSSGSLYLNFAILGRYNTKYTKYEVTYEGKYGNENTLYDHHTLTVDYYTNDGIKFTQLYKKTANTFSERKAPSLADAFILDEPGATNKTLKELLKDIPRCKIAE